MIEFWHGYARSLVTPAVAATAGKVALVIGSLLLGINHGAALWDGKMTRDRWMAAGLTYIVPYLVNAHGQYSSRRQSPTASTPSPN